jgi:hypothetical protein
MITPLLTQLTYEGLIDELIGIKNCLSISSRCIMQRLTFSWVAHVELPVSLLTPPQPQGPANAAGPSTSNPPVVSLKKDNKKKHHLTAATDPLFAELRDLNFSSVGRKLNRVAHRLDENYKVDTLRACCLSSCLLTSIVFQTDLQSKTVTQLRDFVGKLGGLQTEHQSLRLRKPRVK